MLSSALKDLSRHGLIYISATTFNKAASFLLIPLVTAYIGVAENYGVKEIAEVTIALSAQLLGFNVFQGMVRYLANDQCSVSRGKMLFTSLVLVASIASILLVVCHLFSSPIATVVFGSALYAPALRVTSAIIFFSVFTAWGLSYLEAQHSSITYAALTTSKLLLEIALKVVFLVYLDLTYMGVLYSVFWSEALFGSILLISILSRYRPGFSIPVARQLLSYVTPLILSGVCMLVVHQGDRIVIRFFEGLHGVGIYGLGYKLGSIVNALLYTGFATIWFPYVFKLDDDEFFRQLCRNVMILFMAVASFMTLVLAVFGRELVFLMAAEPFHDALTVLPIITFSYLMWMIYQLVHTIFFVKEQTSYVFKIAFIVAVTNTILNIILVPVLGIKGAAYSTLLSYFIAAALAYRLAQRILHVDYDIWRLVVAIALAAFLWMLSLMITSENIVVLISMKAAICLLYPLLLLKFSYLTKQLRSDLIELYQRRG